MAPSAESSKPTFDKPLKLPLSQEEIDRINAYLRDLTPDQILEWAVEHIPGLYQTTAFGLTGLVVDPGDHRGGEVQDLLELLGSHVEQVADTARHTLEELDVRDRCGQVDVTHPLTADLRTRDLDATALADDALVADALVLTAVALPVPGRTEDLLAEEPVLLRLEGAVVDGLGLLDLAVRPLTDVVSGGETDTQFVEEIDVEQLGRFSLSNRYS